MTEDNSDRPWRQLARRLRRAVLASGPFGSPHPLVWLLAITFGVVAARHEVLTTPDVDLGDSIFLGTIFVALLWMAAVAPHLRALDDREWNGPTEAALTVMTRARRFGWSWVAGDIALLFFTGREPRPVFGPGSTALIVTTAVVATVFLVLPDRGDPRSSPLVVALGAGPNYLPRGTRPRVLVGIALIGVAVAGAAGAFGTRAEPIHFIEILLSTFCTFALCGSTFGRVALEERRSARADRRARRRAKKASGLRRTHG